MPSAKELKEILAQLQAHRSGFDGKLRAAAQFALPPDQDDVGAAHTDEGQEYQYPAESVGVRCARQMSAGLFSNTVTPGQQWFRLRAVDDKLNKLDEVRQWIDETSDLVLKALGACNFSLELQELLRTYVTLGTGVLFQELVTRDGSKRLNFRHYSIRGCWITEGPDGLVDGVYRLFVYTPRQAELEFGKENLSQKTQDRLGKPEAFTEQLDFLHAVYRRDDSAADGRRKAGAKNMPWASVYVELDADKIVRTGGFENFPFAVPRCYKLAGKVYGESPAMEALGDLRQLERSSVDWVDAVEMAMIPPLFLPDRQAVETIDLRAGSINYYDPTRGGKPVFLQATGDVQVGEFFIRRKENAVREAFFVDLFMALEAKQQTAEPRTAEEIRELIREKVGAISPVVNRLQSELFGPIVIQAVALLSRAGMLPEPPAVLRGRQYEVEYQTRLDARLADVESSNIIGGLQEIGMAFQILAGSPRLRATVDEDELARTLAYNRRMPLKLLRSPREVKKALEAMAAEAAAKERAALLAAKVKPVDIQQPAAEGSPLAGMMATGGTAG